MIKLSVSFSKKVPGSAEYSSDGFLCALESEVSDSALNNPSELRQRMLFLWSEAKKAVEEQIAQAGNGHKAVAPARAPEPAAPSAPSTTPAPKNGNEPATSKQTKYLISLAQRDRGMKLGELQTFLKDRVGQPDPYKLTKAQASTAIEALGTGGRK